MSRLAIGDTVDNTQAVNLCHQFGLVHLASRIESNPGNYRSWVFDGVSGLPDRLFSLVGDAHAITNLCALPHDLAYAYGNPGDRQERKRADKQFYHNLRQYGNVSHTMAKVCYYAVRLFGGERWHLSFSWGFANNSVQHLSTSPSPWSY